MPDEDETTGAVVTPVTTDAPTDAPEVEEVPATEAPATDAPQE